MEHKDHLQFDYLPLTVSIETLGGISTPMIRRGTPLPTKRAMVFSTATDNQPSVEVKVLFGERPIAFNNMLLGSCMLKEIPLAPARQPQIRVTFEVDKFCKVKVEATETKSGNKLTAAFEAALTTVTTDLIEKMVRDAKENQEEDHARSAIALAELQVRRAQESDLIIASTQKMEALIAETGTALMEGNKRLIVQKTMELDKLLAQPTQTYSPFGFDNIFDAFFPSAPTKKTTQNSQTAVQKDSKTVERQKSDSISSIKTSTTMLLQSFLESINPVLEIKRAGAWEALESNRPDGRSQATHSMREVLRQVLDALAPNGEVMETPWYKKTKNGVPVTRAMRIRYAIAGKSNEVSDSTLSLINDLAAAVDSMYAKLSAESHSATGSTISSTRVFLSACEAVISLIMTQRSR